jgi:hypothetical protein
MFVGLRRAATAKKQRRTVRLKFAAKSENKTYDHFTPISGQASALTTQTADSTPNTSRYKTDKEQEPRVLER